MKKRYTGSLLGVAIISALLLPELATAAVELPSWADQGNLEGELSNKGKNVANIISIIVGILAVIGMLVGAAMFPLNKAEEGKKWVIGGGIGLIIAGSVYGIAALFI